MFETLFAGKLDKMVKNAVEQHGLLLKSAPSQPVNLRTSLDGVKNEHVQIKQEETERLKLDLNGKKNKGKSVKEPKSDMPKNLDGISLKAEQENTVLGKLKTNHWIFRMSDSVVKKDYDELVRELNENAPDHMWSWVRLGQFCHLIAVPKHVHAKGKMEDLEGPVLVRRNFVEDISSVLPWYALPIAVSDPTVHISATNSAILWKMHATPKFVERQVNLAGPVEPLPKLDAQLRYSDLLATAELGANECIRDVRSGAHALVCGPEGSGKTELLLTVAAHVLQHGAVLYACNPKDSIDLDALEHLGIPGVKMVSHNIRGHYEIFKRLLLLATQRYAALKRLGLQNLPLNGRVQLGSRMLLNGNVMNADERVHVRALGNEQDMPAQDIQPGMEIVVPGDRKFRIPNHWELVNQQGIQMGGVAHMPPVLVLVDDLSHLLQHVEGAALGADLGDLNNGANLPDGVMLQEVRVALEVLLEAGRKVNIHFAVASEHVGKNILPVRVLDHMDLRVVTGDLDDESKIAMLGMEGNLQVPQVPGQMLLRLANYDQVYTGYTLLEDGEGILEYFKAKAEKSSAKQKKGKKNDKGVEKKVQQPVKPLAFERYDGVLPNDLPVDVKVDYGVSGLQQKPQVVAQPSDYHFVEIAGRKVRVDAPQVVNVDKQVDLGENLGQTALPNLGGGILPDLSNMDEDVAEDHEFPTRDEQAEEQVIQRVADVGAIGKLPVLVDEGRVDVCDGISIVGDKSSLEHSLAKPQDDEGQEFHIVN